MSLNRVIRVLWQIVVLGSTAFASTAGAAGPDYERWYTVEILQQRAGWMMSSQTTDGGTITNRSKMKIAVKRGEAEVPIYFESEFVETLDHKPVSMRSIKRMGSMPVDVTYRFGDKTIVVETTQGGPEKTTAEEPWPKEEWLTPAAASEQVQARLKAGDDKVVIRTIDPLNGVKPMEVTREVLARTNIVTMGRSVPVTKCRVTQDLVAIPSTDYIDSDGIPVRVETKIGTIGMKMQAATKEEATAQTAAPEVMVSTFVKPDRRIARPRFKKLATFTLSVPKGGSLADLPQAGAQRFERIDDRTARITVDALRPLPAAESDAANAAFLAGSSMIDASDPAVIEMAQEAVKGVEDRPAARAEAIRRHVHKSITTKDLDIGFATASEVARTHEGDCTEHAVLLAALLRAAGIPSRVVSGLVYAEGFAGQSDIFGYHMWAQALLEVDGRMCWIDLDGTLNETTFDATHIALAVSALGDNQTYEALAPMATMIGRLSIKVDSAE